MSMTGHLEELKRKHAALDEEVEALQRAPGSDDIQIHELKKQKLKIKEEIERLTHPH